jgi:hypothetical protein
METSEKPAFNFFEPVGKDDFGQTPQRLLHRRRHLRIREPLQRYPVRGGGVQAVDQMFVKIEAKIVEAAS